MRFKSFKEHFVLIVSLCLLPKILTIGLSLADSLGVLFIFLGVHLKTIIDYQFPERPDLFNEISQLKLKLLNQTERSDVLERDITALKFGASRR